MTAYRTAATNQHTTLADLSQRAKEEKERYKQFLNMLAAKRRERYRQFMEKKRQQYQAHRSSR